jgi:hypothetical protein
MNEDLINDLKQFIAATVSQATAELASKEDLETLASKSNLAGLEHRIYERFDDLDSKVTTIADAQAEALEDHEQRIGRLESGTA